MCLVCKKESEMKTIEISNDITINETYGGGGDDIEYCTYCGALFLDSYKLDKHSEDEDE